MKYAHGSARAVFMIILGATMNLCLGSVYSFSIYRAPLAASLGIDTASSGYPYMVFLATFAFMMPLAGLILDRIGPRKAAMLGGVLMASGWILAGSADTILMVSLAYGLLGGCGVAIAYGVPLALAARWVPTRPGLAAGLALLGFGMSAFITAPLGNYLIGQYDVSVTFRIMGVLFGTVTLICAIPMHYPSQQDKKSAPQVAGIPPRQMLSSIKFWGLWLCFTLGTVVGLTMIGITGLAAQEFAGYSAAAAAAAVSLMAIANGIGRPLFGSIADSVGIRRAALLTYTIITVAALILLAAGTFTAADGLLRGVLFAAGFVFFWLILGGWLAIAPAATAQLFGRRYYSRNYGFVYTGYGAGAILGTQLSGIALRLPGGYQALFFGIVATGIIGLIMSSLLLPRSGQNAN
ncbi:MAG: MFS transporter [Spirochaetaceae bacterium]|nr:MAG: MFS transporter [Spirochaetaceae bacterium]